MAVCKYCGKYNDSSEWPQRFVSAYTPDCCFDCYEENPDRATWGHRDELDEDTETTENFTDPSDLDTIEVPDPTDGECEDDY